MRMVKKPSKLWGAQHTGPILPYFPKMFADVCRITCRTSVLWDESSAWRWCTDCTFPAVSRYRCIDYCSARRSRWMTSKPSIPSFTTALYGSCT